ncbi:hypothetical protein [Parasphingopyxis marina]|uniref:DoxX family protein n=1 Tax=Parasphingopyxis marina TaxID=2761622 RepID=A0A842HXP2_9SPHN|nr:hypothetical protein [Parasphingopyxis marina]MBC2778928.1 hypothetical protein [Parasphingopyxis marina]
MGYQRMIFIARMILGIFYLISGLNWYFGFMPLPSIYMPVDAPMKHAVVTEMIRTGWMFQFAKTAEIVVGLSLLAGRAVPLTLALTVPLAFITFMLDAMIFDEIWGWVSGSTDTETLRAAIADMIIGGLCVLSLHVWLMLCYFDHYRPLFVWQAKATDWGGA